MTRFEYLDIGRFGVTNAGLEHLKGLTILKYLRLQGTKVTSAGAERLQKAVPALRLTAKMRPIARRKRRNFHATETAWGLGGDLPSFFQPDD